jgi:serine/threonine protein kinase
MEPRFSGYTITAPFTSGAICNLYKAVQESTGRVVVIKALKDTVAPSSSLAAQIGREADALAALSHPNVILLIDRLVTPVPALVLEWIEATSLKAFMAKRKVLRSDVACSIAYEVASALEHVHARGFVHRDVKPDNILLCRDGTIKLIDFGIARRIKSPGDEGVVPMDERGELVQAESFGTPAYMAPEQVLGEASMTQSDLYSLGVVLYQLLAGALPVDKRVGGPRALGTREAPVPLRQRAPELPRSLEQIVMKLLERAPSDRYELAAEVRRELLAFSVGVSVDERSRSLRRLLSESTGPALGRTASVPIADPRVARRREITTLGGFLLLGSLFSGVAALERPPRADVQPRVADGLPLVPKQAAALRVTATPWAEVWIDGEHVETTPFAHPIPLSPGKHWVSLRHPNATEERRDLLVQPGEVIALDVTLDVRAAMPKVVASSTGEAGAP